MFFEFYRILECVRRLNNGHHLFWLFENVASMSKETKDTMSRFLGVRHFIYFQ